MNIRLSNLNDLEATVEIYNQAIVTHQSTADTNTFTVNERLEWFNDHQCNEYPLYVYEIDSKVVGYIYFTGYRPGRKAMKHTAEISYYIHNDYRQREIGSDMLAFALKVSNDLNFKNLIAIILSVNIGSIKLLSKFGFTKWGCLPDIAGFDGIECSHYYYGLKL
jgi:phosphinothricin acetyltransferase